jgi:tetratricopeptide (TPR) repeat protein
LRLPWHEISREQFERLVYDLLESVGFQRRVFIESGPRSPEGHDIVAYRDNEILPDLGYPEKWLAVPIPYTANQLTVENVEFVKRWADEPYHEVDYIIFITPSHISLELEDWILKFNRFPIKKYKIKILGRTELEQLVCSSEDLLGRYFPGFKPKALSIEEEKEIEELVSRKILNFRSDLGIVDIYLNIIFTFPQEKQMELINKLAAVWSFEGFERLKRWNSGWILIRLARLSPNKVPLNTVREVALKGETVYRAQAAHIYCWLSLAKPEMVDPLVLGKMIESDSDYFVYVPATKALVQLIQSNEETLTLVLNMLRSESPETRRIAASILYALADENPMMVPKTVCELLSAEDDEKIRQLGEKISEKLLSFWEAPLRAEFRKARDEFEKKNYARAQVLFEALSRKSDFSLRWDCKWWSGYSLYLLREYNRALNEFNQMLKDISSEGTALWWMSIVYEKLGRIDESIRCIHKLNSMCEDDSRKVRIAPERELSCDQLKPLLFKRLKELNERKQ